MVLEGQLKNTCNWYPSISEARLERLKAETFTYIHLDQVNVNPRPFLDFALAGCNVLASQDNILFDEYKYVSRYPNTKHAVDMIMESIRYSDTLEKNSQLIEDIEAKHSLQNFQHTLKKIIMENYNV